MKRAVFLDRDGVINEDSAYYVKNLKELTIFPWVPESIKRLNEAGYEVLIISNQQGVAKGLIGEDDLGDIQLEITRRVETAGGNIGSFYHCTHLATDGCSCRKPEPGLILKAAEEHGIDIANSYMVGDSERDLKAGKSAGCRTILVFSGSLTEEDAKNIATKPDYAVRDLSEAADIIIGLETTAS